VIGLYNRKGRRRQGKQDGDQEINECLVNYVASMSALSNRGSSAHS
jgi:hypothetical protein